MDFVHIVSNYNILLLHNKKNDRKVFRKMNNIFSGVDILTPKRVLFIFLTLLLCRFFTV